MGPENSEKLTVYMMIDGEPVKIGPGIFKEIRYTSNAPCNHLLLTENEVELVAWIPLPEPPERSAPC